MNRDLNERWCSDAMDLANAAVEAACPGMAIQLMVDTARAYTPTQGCEYRAASFGQ